MTCDLNLAVGIKNIFIYYHETRLQYCFIFKYCWSNYTIINLYFKDNNLISRTPRLAAEGN